MQDDEIDDPPEFEPHVGEVRAVRTFRVGPGGVLFPLFSHRPWQDGPNEAICRVVHATGDPTLEHVAPEPDCTCGFYAYADLSAADEYPYARNVLAVVTCWGRIIVGTKGLRAQWARVTAVWVSASVPADLTHLLTERYPSATIYTDRDAMLAQHAPTVLADYEQQGAEAARRHTVTSRVLVSLALLGGIVPSSWLGYSSYGWPLWAATLAVLSAVAFAPRGGRRDVVVQRRRLTCIALALWMLAPTAGAAGVLFLRLPLLQLVLLTTMQRVVFRRMANTFPAKIV